MPNNMLPMRFMGQINAGPGGFPSAAEGYEDQSLNIHEWLVKNPAATFFYWVRGDELESEHIRNGAMLVVDRSIVPPHRKLYLIEGKLVLAEQFGEFIICRFCEKEKVEVCGVVTAIVLKL